MKRKYDYLRPAEHVVFAAKIWNGCTLYQIDGAPVYFGTKKDAAAYIRENFSGDAAAVRLYDLRNAGRSGCPRRSTLPAVFNDEEKVKTFKNLCRSYKYSDTNKLCLEKVWNCGRGRTRFIHVYPEKKIVFYNTLTARRADIQRIRETWPNYQPVAVDMPYYITLSLKAYWNAYCNPEMMKKYNFWYTIKVTDKKGNEKLNIFRKRFFGTFQDAKKKVNDKIISTPGYLDTAYIESMKDGICSVHFITEYSWDAGERTNYYKYNIK